jgi:hypothetical protein
VGELAAREANEVGAGDDGEVGKDEGEQLLVVVDIWASSSVSRAHGRRLAGVYKHMLGRSQTHSHCSTMATGTSGHRTLHSLATRLGEAKSTLINLMG